MQPTLRDDIARLLNIAKATPAEIGRRLQPVFSEDAERPAGRAVAPQAPSPARPARPRALPPVAAADGEAMFRVQTLLAAVAVAVALSAALTGSSLVLLPTYEVWRYEPPAGPDAPGAGKHNRMGSLVRDLSAVRWKFGEEAGRVPASRIAPA